MLYAYIKSDRYSGYRIIFEGNEDLKEIDLTFESMESMQEFIINFSNYNSIPVQYYI